MILSDRKMKNYGPENMINLYAKVSNLVRHLCLILCILLASVTAVTAEIYVSEIQNYLNAGGYDAGKIDGKWGKRTEAAITRFYSDNSMKWTGKINEDDLSKIKEVLVKRGKIPKENERNRQTLEIQKYLQALGYFDGVMNGKWDDKSINATKSFSQSYRYYRNEGGFLPTYSLKQSLLRAISEDTSIQRSKNGVINVASRGNPNKGRKNKYSNSDKSNLSIKSLERKQIKGWSGCKPKGQTIKATVKSVNPLENLSFNNFGKLFRNDRTINQFRPWAGAQLGAKDYTLRWDDERKKKMRGQGADLTSINWAYQWTYGKLVKFYPGIENYLTDIKYNKDSAYYDAQTATNIFDKTYGNYIATTAAKIVKTNKTDGVLLDWWHDNHPIVYQTSKSASQFKAQRKEIIKKLHEKLGSDALIVANTNDHRDTSTHSHLNGVFIEFLTRNYWNGNSYSCRDLLDAERLLQLHDEKLQPPKVVAFKPQHRSKTMAEVRDPFNLQLSRLYAAMSAVIPRNGFFHYMNNDVMTVQSESLRNQIKGFRFPVVQINLGGKKSGFTKIRDGIGYREFKNGFVAYNATNKNLKLRLANGETLELGSLNAAFCHKTSNSYFCE